MFGEYTERREWLLNALNNIPGLRCPQPEGAFYAFPDVRGCLKGDLQTSADFVNDLLEKEHTVVTDGAGFGADGFIRISYATSLDRLNEGVERMKRIIGVSSKVSLAASCDPAMLDDMSAPPRQEKEAGNARLLTFGIR